MGLRELSSCGEELLQTPTQLFYVMVKTKLERTAGSCLATEHFILTWLTNNCEQDSLKKRVCLVTPIVAVALDNHVYFKVPHLAQDCPCELYGLFREKEFVTQTHGKFGNFTLNL